MTDIQAFDVRTMPRDQRLPHGWPFATLDAKDKPWHDSAAVTMPLLDSNALG